MHALFIEDIDALPKLYAGLHQLIRLKAKTLRGPEHSTIPLELAETLVESISFTIQYTSENNASLTASYLNAEISFLDFAAAAEYYLNQQVQKLRARFEAKSRFLYRLNNRAYEETVFSALPGFFNHYDTVYKAHDYLITADYPLCVEQRQLKGLSFIEAYLTNLFIENRFLTSFGETAIHDLLTAYSPIQRELVFNISEAVINNALFCHILKKPFGSLTLTASDIEMLYVIFSGESQPRIHHWLETAYASLMSVLQLNQTSCLSYYLPHLKSLSHLMVSHCENESLDHYLAIG